MFAAISERPAFESLRQQLLEDERLLKEQQAREHEGRHRETEELQGTLESLREQMQVTAAGQTPMSTARLSSSSRRPQRA